MIIMIQMTVHLPRPEPKSMLLTKSPPPTMMYRAMKMFAPNMVHMTIPVALIVLTAAWTRLFQDIRPLITPMIQAPRHPTPAASVGAATPMTIVPRTRKIRIARRG